MPNAQRPTPNAQRPAQRPAPELGRVITVTNDYLGLCGLKLWG